MLDEQLPEQQRAQPQDVQPLDLRPSTPLSTKLMLERNVGRLAFLERIMHRLSPGERMLLYGLSILLAVSALILLVDVNKNVSVTVPAHGGSLSEGAIGAPRFVNPLLSISQTDQDLAALVYSGLMRVKPDGDITFDLANEYQISEDGTTYTFHIRPDATFHDGAPVRAEDVVFTVGLAQNQDIKSPRRADWDGVTVTASDERTVVFTLSNAYGPFLENTQLGILPKHLWEKVAVEEFPFHALNTNPVGSGPFEVRSVTTDDAGSPLSYELSAFKWFAPGRPHLNKIVFHFYSNESALMQAFREGEIDSFAGVNPDETALSERTDTKVVRAASTRIFAIFFNQNHAPVLADAAVRSALNTVVERDSLIASALSGYGKAAEGPIPPGLLGYTASTASSTTKPVEAAAAILLRNGWKQNVSTSSPDSGSAWTKGKNTLSLALATADTPELTATAEAVANSWRALGVRVDVQVYPLAEFNANVLRPRQYDAILFGEVVGRTLDLFAFWHSSQRNDPGLNLALYANTKADKLLAGARTEADRETREQLYRDFSEIIDEDQPAVFLYAPEFLYVVPNKLQGLSFGALTSPSERFLSVHEWYMDTERVWSIFSHVTEPIIDNYSLFAYNTN